MLPRCPQDGQVIVPECRISLRNLPLFFTLIAFKKLKEKENIL